MNIPTPVPASTNPSDDREFASRLSALTDHDLEQRLAAAYESRGYTVDLDTGHDGVNLMLQIADQVWLVQTRNWRSASVDVEPVREMIAEVNRNEATGGIVVCAGTFTEAARLRVRGSGVRLLNGVELSGMLFENTRYGDQQDCPRCGSSLVERLSEGVSRRFRGCSDHPACQYTTGAAA
jgi:restriction system protein